MLQGHAGCRLRGLYAGPCDQDLSDPVILCLLDDFGPVMSELSAGEIRANVYIHVALRADVRPPFVRMLLGASARAELASLALSKHSPTAEGKPVVVLVICGELVP